MSEHKTPVNGFADTFLSKLKEQSFTILVMVGVIYYQHRLMEERVMYDDYILWHDIYREILNKNPELVDSAVLKEVNQLANEYKVSEVSRGIKKSSKTDNGFFQMYKYVKGKSYKLQYIPIKENKPEGQDYWSYRIGFIKSRLAQMKKLNIPLYYKEGKYKGLPTKQHLVLIFHAYSPNRNL
jgi:hypothetical protein